MNITQEQKEQIKTVVIIALAVIAFFGITYIISENTGDRSKDKEILEQETTQNPLLVEGETLNEEEQKELTSFSMDDLKTALENNEKKFVMLGTETCSWCNYQKPLLRSVAYRYDIEIDYLDLNQLSSTEIDELEAMHESLESFGTPTFIIVKDGSVSEVSIGGMTTQEIENILRENEFID